MSFNNYKFLNYFKLVEFMFKLGYNWMRKIKILYYISDNIRRSDI